MPSRKRTPRAAVNLERRAVPSYADGMTPGGAAAQTADDLTATVADNLRAARTDRGFSQRALAELSGIYQGHISHFEMGRRQPLIHNLVRLANALEVSTDYLLGRAPLPPRRTPKP
jgi:ribosome-binding protein aMBF1 (putative translation factor)